MSQPNCTLIVAEVFALFSLDLTGGLPRHLTSARSTLFALLYNGHKAERCNDGNIDWPQLESLRLDD
jgi:hypothetical protein